MKLAESSHRKIEIFFREYLNDSDFRLPSVNIYAGKFTDFFTKIIKVAGITFGKRIFVLPELLSFNRNDQLKLPEELVVHEITHVLQYQRYGFLGFFYKYLRDYRANLRKKEIKNAETKREAYLEIPFEVEARDAADKFVKWNVND